MAVIHTLGTIFSRSSQPSSPLPSFIMSMYAGVITSKKFAPAFHDSLFSTSVTLLFLSAAAFAIWKPMPAVFSACSAAKFKNPNAPATRSPSFEPVSCCQNSFVASYPLLAAAHPNVAPNPAPTALPTGPPPSPNNPPCAAAIPAGEDDNSKYIFCHFGSLSHWKFGSARICCCIHGSYLVISPFL